MGAIANYNYANLTISGCTLSGNSTASGNGGAISIGGYATVTVTNSMLTSNSANEDGGAIFNGPGSNLVLSSCNLSGNTAYDGGGLYTYSSTEVDGCILPNNIAQEGSAIYSNTGYGILYVFDSVFTNDDIVGPYVGSGNTFN